ncbi:MAG TPA: UDP-N-acetylmuramoyl-L-alanyl-D-glutamate--2,6-diaminopimelate ligase [Phycisphaerales bacterium]|nr:UDP-N-acetylmuramoyl-L-alanyl-D-glutamate--2,6-diaminopimelate ligase [Phycisphaerales bacterium]
MMLEELISGLDVRVVAGKAAGVRVCDLTEDSRTVVPGSMFIARGGNKADGKLYVESALRSGAVAVLTDDAELRLPRGFAAPVVHAADVLRVSGQLAERFYGQPAGKLKLIGVTGTNGKTTTTYLVWQLLNAAGTRCGLIGTVLVDDGAEVASASMTTPPAIEISRTLGIMVEGGCRAATLEVSSHALDQKRAEALPFAAAVFTNLTGDHLDYHKTMDEYAAAKARLFELLAPGGVAIVNAHDGWSQRMVRDFKGPVLRCGVGVGSMPVVGDCTAHILEESIHGMLLKLTGPWGTVQASVPLIGRYNAMNVLQAAAVCHAVGMSEAELTRGLPRVTAPPGRLERVSEPGDKVSVFVDYAHSDDSLKNVLASVGSVMESRRHASGRVHDTAGAPTANTPGGRLWVVFGCGGERDRTKRPRMGLVAATHADFVVITNDNPRTEKPGDIVDEILSGITAELKDKVSVQIDRQRAIRLAIESALPGDVIVIAGKGHETEQILPDGAGGTIRTHFDDREVARTILEERRPPVERPAVEVKARRPGGARGAGPGAGPRPPKRSHKHGR